MKNLTTAFPNFSSRIYGPFEVYKVYEKIRPELETVKKRIKSDNGFRIIELYNCPAAFDTENSSFYEGENKVAITYVWSFCINGVTVLGRTWPEYLYFINTLSSLLHCNDKKRLVVYVHNLGYDFQFMRKRFEWNDVFSIKERTPIYAVTNGVEYRCSYILSGYSLEKIGKDLNNPQLKKLVGYLDYDKIRHTKTPLTKEEKLYCVNDVRVLVAYIYKKIQEDGGIQKIPYTKTGYVRRFCRNECYYHSGKKSVKFWDYISKLTINDSAEYKQLKRAFQGGFTHANPFMSGEVLENVASYDFTSSYPAVMVAEKFPVSRSKRLDRVFLDENEVKEYFNKFCCIFDIEFIGIKSVVLFDSYISESRCWKLETPVVNNGRVVSATILRTTLTEQDFLIIRKMYKWESFIIANMRIYAKDYLPTEFIKAILELYQRKTTLKGVKGKEVDYLKSKEMLNSCYGMAVTDIVRSAIEYSGDWTTTEPDIDKKIEEYNTEKGRFLFYPWGVWVTAYARRNLFSGILEAGNDYIYADTDSIKILNRENHTQYIDKYNSVIVAQLKRALKHHGLDENLITPKTSEGIEKPLGVWDYEGTYNKFKTLGAKRYLVQYNSGEYSLTVAGLNKRSAVPYMEQKYADIFKAFSNRLEIPQGNAGKLTHTYIDDERRGFVTDYMGNSAEYMEKSAVHLEQAGYSLKLSEKYIRYLKNIKEMG